MSTIDDTNGHRSCQKVSSAEFLLKIKMKAMKKFFSASGVALFVTCFYVWGSRPAAHSSATGQSIYKTSVNDTVPRKRDTLNRRDTMGRRDSL